MVLISLGFFSMVENIYKCLEGMSHAQSHHLTIPHGREVATEKRNLDPLAAGCCVFFLMYPLVI